MFDLGVAVNRWTYRFVAIYFLVQLAFQTILSSEVSEQTGWNLYWIFVGMSAVLLFDALVNQVRRRIKTDGAAEIDRNNS